MVQITHRDPGEQTPVTTMENPPSAFQLLPPELLLKMVTFVDVAVDLQNLRLVNRAFSKAVTTVLQDRSFRIYLLPTRPSMDRFTKLTQDSLIAPKIIQAVILYRPPYACPVPPTCRAIAERYGMPRQKVREIVYGFALLVVLANFLYDAFLKTETCLRDAKRCSQGFLNESIVTEPFCCLCRPEEQLLSQFLIAEDHVAAVFGHRKSSAQSLS